MPRAVVSSKVILALLLASPVSQPERSQQVAAEREIK